MGRQKNDERIILPPRRGCLELVILPTAHAVGYYRSLLRSFKLVLPTRHDGPVPLPIPRPNSDCSTALK